MKYLVNVNGNSVTINETTEGEDGTLTATGDPVTSIVNTLIPYASVTVKKVDADSNPLDGANFQINQITETGSIPYDTFTAYPSTTLSDLPAGSYTITETKAPAGYYGVSGTISFTVENGAVTINGKLPSGVAFTGSGTEDNPYTFTVTNTPGVELPSTGGAGTLPYTMGGLLLMAASLLYGFGQRRKGERGDAI